MDNLKKTILVVEDDVLLQKAMTEKFTRERFNVIFSLNGEEGLQCLSSFLYRPDEIRRHSRSC